MTFGTSALGTTVPGAPESSSVQSNVQSATPSFTGTGALSVLSGARLVASLAFTGSGQLSCGYVPGFSFASAFAASGALSATGLAGGPRSFPSFAGSGSLSFTQRVSVAVSPRFSGSGQLNVVTPADGWSVAPFTGDGTLNATALLVGASAAAFTGGGTLSSVSGRVYNPAELSQMARTPSASGSVTNSTGVELTFSGTYEVRLPAASLAMGSGGGSPELARRALLGVAVTMPTPVIISGQPTLPRFVLRTSSSLTTTSSVVADGDPDLTGGAVPDVRWLASDLALTGEYMNSWPAHGSGPAWNSVYPYRPKLRAHQAYGRGPRRHTYSNLVFFNPDYVEHMWLDAGTLPQPYTWIFAGIILGYPHARYGHFILDAGKATPVFAIGTDNVINDGLSTRSALMADRKQVLVNTNPKLTDGPYVSAKHDYAPRPKVFVAEFNGASSYAGAMDTHSRRLVRGRTSVASQRYFVTGRAQNNVSDEYACHMALMEIRLYKRSMATAEITAIYKQLAATYRFNKF